ncbi:hypothetical protein BJ944DRAFT_10368 [Cunninghamella echinulata]|nr:hypothetical protein BJ944DRAFT_10368 [Cunninghamella echinulata]
MTDKQSFTQELFWLEQEDANSDNETFLPSDTPCDSPIFSKLKKRSIKTRFHHVYNKTIQKQVNEFNELQKDFSFHIDNRFLSKNGRHKPIFEVIDGSKFVEKHTDEFKKLLHDITNQKEQISNEKINGMTDVIMTTDEDNIKEEYQNEVLKMYSSLIETYRIRHRNQLSIIQKQFNEQLLKENDSLAHIHDDQLINKEQSQISATTLIVKPKKSVRFIDTTRDPRLKQSLHQQQSSLSNQLQPFSQQLVQQHQQVQKHINYNKLPIITNEQQQHHQPSQSELFHHQMLQPQNHKNSNIPPAMIKEQPSSSKINLDIVSNKSYISNNNYKLNLQPDVDVENQTLSTLPSSKPEVSSTSIVQLESTKSSSTTSLKSTVLSTPEVPPPAVSKEPGISSSPEISMFEVSPILPSAVPSSSSPSNVDLENYDIKQLELDIKKLPGKFLIKNGEIDLDDNDNKVLIWRKHIGKSTIIRLGTIRLYERAYKAYKKNVDKSDKWYTRTLKSFKEKGFAVNCSCVNNAPIFVYMPSLNRKTWIKVGTADAVVERINTLQKEKEKKDDITT